MLPVRRRRPVRGSAVPAAALLALLVFGCARAPTRPAEIDEPPVPAPAPKPDREPEPVPEPVAEPEPAPPAAEVALPDSAEASPPDEARDIVVELDEEERATLAANAERDLLEAERSIRDAERRALSAESRETLATIEGLLAAARDALGEEDVQAAATLAHKARLLAAELASN